MGTFLKTSSNFFIQIRTRFNSRHPRPAPIDRRIFEIITKPIYEEQLEPDPVKSCSIMKYRKIDQLTNSSGLKKNLYEEFLTKELLMIFNENKMVVCCHHDNIDFRRMMQIRNIFLNENICITFFPSDVIRNSLMGSKWSNMIQLFTNHTCMLLCQEEKVLKLLNLAIKISDIHILGGLVGDRLLTKQGLVDRSKLTTSTDLIANTVAIMQHPTVCTSSVLIKHLQLLVHYLKQHIEKTS